MNDPALFARMLLWRATLEQCDRVLRMAIRAAGEQESREWPGLSGYLASLAFVQLVSVFNLGYESATTVSNKAAQAERDATVREAFPNPTVHSEFLARFKMIENLRNKLIGHIDGATANVQITVGPGSLSYEHVTAHAAVPINELHVCRADVWLLGQAVGRRCATMGASLTPPVQVASQPEQQYRET